jgi:hypothetical protein
MIFKIGGPKLHFFENRGTKSAFKPIFFYPIKPRVVVLMCSVRGSSKYFKGILKIPKIIRLYFEYPRPTGYILREETVYLVR